MNLFVSHPLAGWLFFIIFVETNKKTYIPFWNTVEVSSRTKLGILKERQLLDGFLRHKGAGCLLGVSFKVPAFVQHQFKIGSLCPFLWLQSCSRRLIVAHCLKCLIILEIRLLFRIL